MWYAIRGKMGRLAIAMFVDACGWGVVEPRPWFLEQLDHRYPVQSLFGYSSACVPAILTGRSPDDSDHWSCFWYSPDTSPFKPLRYLRALPSSLVDRGRVRRYLSAAIARAYGYTGYFQIYNLPFEVLPLFDYGEKKDIFQPNGINRGTSLFDDLTKAGVRYHVSNWRKGEEENVASLDGALASGNLQFAFLYTPKLDAIMHDHTKDSRLADDKLRWYEKRVVEILAKARARYDEVRFAVFSDHGMATVRTVVDLMPRLDGLDLTFGEDYAAVYDSTMMRFWFLKPHAEARIRNAFPDGETGRWITEEQHKAFGTFWKDGKFGHAIYALEPGVLLNPSHMGKVPMQGMHGYRPDHHDSYATMLANFAPAAPVAKITDFYGVMRDMADWATGASTARS